MYGKRPLYIAAPRLANAARRQPFDRRRAAVLAPPSMNRPIAVEDLALRLPAKARLIGIDLGTKTIGLALSDVERRIASPLKTLPARRSRRTPTRSSRFSPSSRSRDRARPAARPRGARRARARNRRAPSPAISARRTDLPIAYWDERFSTAVVLRSLIENDVSRAQARGGRRQDGRGLHSAGRAGPTFRFFRRPMKSRPQLFLNLRPMGGCVSQQKKAESDKGRGRSSWRCVARRGPCSRHRPLLVPYCVRATDRMVVHHGYPRRKHIGSGASAARARRPVEGTVGAGRHSRVP